jgi:hypothetical protein
MIARPGLRSAYRLALAVGRVDVGRMLRELSAEEFIRWQAYLSIEPLFPAAEDFRTARICASVAQFSQYKKLDGSPFTPGDFMQPPPSVRREPKIEGLGGALVAAFKGAGAVVVEHADDR